jgi:hypothetical protein
VTSFNVDVHSFTMGFGPFQQGLLVVNIVHSGMTVSLHRSFISFYFMYDIDSLFVLVNFHQKFFVWFICYHSYGLNQTITLLNFIGSIVFFLFLYKYYHCLNIHVVH